MMYWNYGPFMHTFGGGFPWLVLLVIFIVVLALSREGRKYRYNDSAMDLLRERYVKGEITRHEFEEKKKDLMM